MIDLCAIFHLALCYFYLFLPDQETSVVVFTARNSGGFSVLVGDTIIFDVVDVNLGNAYDPVDGEFVAPVSGFYSISYQVLADASCPSFVVVWLEHNGITTHRALSDINGSAGSSINLQLTAGDNVRLTFGDGSPCTNLDPNTASHFFSGHLIYKTI